MSVSGPHSRPRLNAEVAHDLIASSQLLLPGYPREHHDVGIVHFGLGAFARAHIAVYTDSALAAGSQASQASAVNGANDWRILGVSLRSRDVQQQLLPQDSLYTVTELAGDTRNQRLIGALADVMVAPDDPSAVLEALRRPQVRIVSSTVTEKGYCHDPASGELRVDQDDIQWDLAHLATPRTLLGFLTAALAERYRTGQVPFTPLCCDNLAGNGKLLRQLVMQFAALARDNLPDGFDSWLSREVNFPCSMVDRIVPATTPLDLQSAAVELGAEDHAVVKAEPFSQWVLEDDFNAGRPRWELAGALFTSDVAAFETLKLRLLNGSHSAIAYLGVLSGFEFVHDVMQQSHLRAFVHALMTEELAPSCDPPDGFDVGDYQDQLLVRFSNSALMHETRQIAMDGSQKLPQRLLAPLRQRLLQNASFERICVVIAAWILCMSRPDFGIEDPLADRYRRICADEPTAQHRARAFLRLTEIFGADLSGSTSAPESALEQRVLHWVQLLERDGVTAALATL